MNEQIKKAEECVRQHAQHLRWGIAGDRDTFRWIAEALDAEGLLATPAMRQAVEACKHHFRQFPDSADRFLADDSCCECSIAGRAALAEDAERMAKEAERAPKPRYALEAFEFNGRVKATYDGSFVTTLLTREQAEAVRDTLNGLERGK
jgi:hypothetical protein